MRLRALSLAALISLVPSVAFASGGSADDQDTLTVLGFLAGISAAYVFAHYVVDKLQQRFLVIAGLEYLLLGVLLGPVVAGVLQDLPSVFPIIALAAGWIGLLRGMEFEFGSFVNRPRGTMRIVILHHGVPGLLVGWAAFTLISDPNWLEFVGATVDEGGRFHEEPWRELAASALFLGIAAATDSAEPFDLLRRRYAIEGKLTEQLRAATRLGDVFVILAFGLIFCFFHVSSESSEGVRPAEWFLLQMGIGGALWVFFSFFLGGDETPNGRFLAMVGIITFAGGAAFFVQLSPLAVNVVLGILLVNIARSGRRTGRQMYETLTNTERPMTLVLTVLAGALWRPPPLVPTLWVLAGFLVLRHLGKFLASRLAAFGQADIRDDLFLGLLNHGEVTIAMAVSFQLVFDGPSADVAYTVVLVSSLLSDLIAPRALRTLLVNAGEIRRERRPSTNEPSPNQMA